MLLRTSCVGCTVFIRSLRDDLFDRVVVCFVQGRQFRNLDNPVVLKHLRYRLWVFKGHQKRRLPALAYPLDESRLTSPLRTGDHHHGVILYSRLHRPGHGRCETLSPDFSGINVILIPEIVDIHGIQPRHTVPNQSVQIILQRVMRSYHRSLYQGVLHRGFRTVAQQFLRVHPQSRIVVVRPFKRFLFFSARPRHHTYAFDPLAELVVLQLFFQPRISLQHDENVVCRMFYFPGFADFQILHPGHIERSFPFRLRHLCQIRCYRSVPFGIDQIGYLCVASRIGAHFLVTRQPVHRGIRLYIVVPITKQMESAQIETVAQLPSRGIGCMMRIEKFIIIH